MIPSASPGEQSFSVRGARQCAYRAPVDFETD